MASHIIETRFWDPDRVVLTSMREGRRRKAARKRATEPAVQYENGNADGVQSDNSLEKGNGYNDPHPIIYEITKTSCASDTWK